jgi:hypothetical protein
VRAGRTNLHSNCESGARPTVFDQVARHLYTCQRQPPQRVAVQVDQFRIVERKSLAKVAERVGGVQVRALLQD